MKKIIFSIIYFSVLIFQFQENYRISKIDRFRLELVGCRKKKLRKRQHTESPLLVKSIKKVIRLSLMIWA